MAINVARRIPTLPRIRVGVLYVPGAIDEFERAVQQAPKFDDDVVHGYIGATIYWNRPETWLVLEELASRGIVWMPDNAQELLQEALTHV